MTEDYRDGLFEHYDVRTDALDSDEAAKLAWFAGYVRKSYLAHLVGFEPSTAEVLDIGCNRGYVLSALTGAGFTRLHGIDLSPGDIDHARRIAPTADLVCVDAFDYLADHPAAFDVILMKAVLEHVHKERVLPLLTLIASALRPNGVALIDVPNMDWLFAGHERYMDFTHEGGFTPESLWQAAGTVFADVAVFPIDNSLPYGRLGQPGVTNAVRIKAKRIRTSAARALLGTLLRWADPDGAAGPIWARSILAVVKAPR